MTTMTIPTPDQTTTPAVQRPACSPGSVVALTTTITQDRVEGDVDILAVTEAVELTDSPRGLGRLIPGALHDSERTMLNDELAAYTSRYPRGAVVLERLIARGAGEIVHLEARLIPLARGRARRPRGVARRQRPRTRRRNGLRVRRRTAKRLGRRPRPPAGARVFPRRHRPPHGNPRRLTATPDLPAATLAAAAC